MQKVNRMWRIGAASQCKSRIAWAQRPGCVIGSRHCGALIPIYWAGVMTNDSVALKMAKKSGGHPMKEMLLAGLAVFAASRRSLQTRTSPPSCRAHNFQACPPRPQLLAATKGIIPYRRQDLNYCLRD
jgi:hypothetical protein